MDENCIFCKIINKEIPANIVYEDEYTLAFHDINPAAPIHVLVIPKKHIKSIIDVTAEDNIIIQKIHETVRTVAEKLELDQTGFRLIVNCGVDGGQEVPHLHFHILGGKKLGPKIAH